MPKYNAVQYVELFHLVFLDLLGRKLDRKSYCLKGGCNLRFFLKSFRYSEDMDIDVAGIGKEKLEEAVEGIVTSDTFLRILRVNGISLDKSSAPKQTETTQRWKFLIRGDGIGGVLNTKIEFSRRGFKGETEFVGIDPLIIYEYALQPIMASHYGKDSEEIWNDMVLRTTDILEKGMQYAAR